ncbi:divalent-cation tolerance protein CutA [Halobellus ruber]|uniref:Divalent-cation tolerance protein CutA n=1 Tax=Halobellus ruber TaxID=2761102 RepID=A0A7J9SI31_9EURY|nr:divalent-cation tolerance protein CutA [Halobellus ruber]MBB6645637.1 divalent-cation tolerance protein CutA [Halobellus ruber]
MPTVYATAPRDAADDLARFLVENRLAACVNVVDCDSVYRWDGTLYDDEAEAILFAKTTAERYPDLKRELEAEHPDDVPCIERFDAVDTLEAYADWVGREVR